MQSSPELISHIKASEGYRSRAYRCPAGVYTAGYGHTKGVTARTSCNESTADRWLSQDLAPCEAFCSAIPQIDTQGKFDACVDFCFNAGINAFRGSTLFKLIRAVAPVERVQAEFRKWVYAKGVQLPGLVKRRAWEASRFALMLCVVLAVLTGCRASRPAAAQTVQNTTLQTSNTVAAASDTVFRDRFVERIVSDVRRTVSSVSDSTATVVDTDGNILRTDHWRTERTADSSSSVTALRDSLRDLRLLYKTLLSAKVEQSEVQVPVERKLASWERFFIHVGIVATALVVLAAVLALVWLIHRKRER